MPPPPSTIWMRWAIALVWLCTGLGVAHPTYRAVGQYYLDLVGFPTWTMYAACSGEVALGIAVVMVPAKTWITAVQIALIVAFTGILAVHEPLLLAHPFGVLSKNVPLLTLLYCAWRLQCQGWTNRTQWVLRCGMAVIWITEGLFPKILFQQTMELEVVSRSGLVPMDSAVFLVLMGILQICSGVAVLVLRGRPLSWLLVLQLIALIVLPLLVSLRDLTLWVHPFGPITKNVPIIVGTTVVLLRVTPFLSAHWSNILVVSFAVPRDVLWGRLPTGVQLDARQNMGLVSFVCLDFQNTAVLGIPCYGFRRFADVNLRFYAHRGDRGGVVFVRELIPLWLPAWVARVVFGEPFGVAKVDSQVRQTEELIRIARTIEHQGRRHVIRVEAFSRCEPPSKNSDTEFFLERYWGFTKRRGGRLTEFRVSHPAWHVHSIRSWHLDVDWQSLYGSEWAFLRGVEPCSIELAAGSDVDVWFDA